MARPYELLVSVLFYLKLVELIYFLNRHRRGKASVTTCGFDLNSYLANSTLKSKIAVFRSSAYAQAELI